MQTTLNSTTQNAAAASADAISASTDASGLSDMFTKLLVAQIQNQDPLAPTDPSQFVNQLTQLSQVEALQKMASQSSSSGGMLQSLQLLALGAQVGSTLAVKTDAVQLAGTAVHGTVTLDNAASQLKLTLTGADGVPHPVALGAHAAGTVAFEIDPSALGLADGRYALAVQTDTGARPSVEIAGALESVRLGANGSALLSVAGVGSVDASSITQFNGRSAGVNS